MAASNLVFNPPAHELLARTPTKGTTLHFTFGSIVMLEFVHNWLHFVRKAGIAPALVGAADASLLSRCGEEGVPAVGVRPDLDVWSYKRKPATEKAVFDLKSDWKYYRHHKSSFLEMGLVKAAFLWELLTAGFAVLISDLDVVWLTPHWRRWMAYGDPSQPPLPEASLMAFADVLVSTDEVNLKGDDARSGWGFHSELNTGVLYFRCTPGALGVVQAWRAAMMAVRTADFVNDQGIFNNVIHQCGVSTGGVMERYLLSATSGWKAELIASGLHDPADVERAIASKTASTREVLFSSRKLRPCLPHASGDHCAPVRFTLATLPARGFTNGHTWFNQGVADMPGHEESRYAPVTVHFTFQFGDTSDYPHGKRQRAREAALWSVDPPEYFTEGVFVQLTGPLYTSEQQRSVERKFPEWSPQRHMHMDALQRAGVRDVLALATALGGIMIMPKLHCFCDRYWNFLSNCRFPIASRDMPVPFWCPQDALYDLVRWNSKGVKFREATFLDNPHVPKVLRENIMTVVVAEGDDEAVAAAAGAESGGGSAGDNGNVGDGKRSVLRVAPGTSMAQVAERVRAANPDVRLIQISRAHIGQLCKWLGSSNANRRFNALSRYILTDSSRYCPNEDHRGFGGWDWRNPFTAYNCTWGFHYPAVYPEQYPCDGPNKGSALIERSNSTTCPRQMLCGWNTIPDGREVGKTTFCNIEGYGGMCSHDPSGGCRGAVEHMLSQMPDNRCPYPPGDVPGGGKGLDRYGNWVGT